MSILDEGVQSAKRQTIKLDPLLQLCQKVWEDRPRGIDDPLGPKMVARFREAVEEDPEYETFLAVIYDGAWARMYARISKTPPTQAEKAAAQKDRVARVERMKLEISNKLDAKVQMMFLDMVMANGKTLRACTRGELVKLKPKQDKVIAGILRTLKKSSDVVGERFKTNDELAAFLK